MSRAATFLNLGPIPFVLTRASLPILAALVGLSGCRLKNEETTHLSGYDTVSGYYGSTLTGIVGTVKLRDEATPRTRPLSTSFAYDPYLNAISDPVLVYVDSPLTKQGSLRNNADTSVGLPVGIDFDRKTIGTDVSLRSTIDDCAMDESEQHVGNISDAPLVVGKFNERGRMSGTFTYGFVFSGLSAADGCVAPLADFFESCYLNATHCTEKDAQRVRNVFDRWVTAGIIDATDIHRVESLKLMMTYR